MKHKSDVVKKAKLPKLDIFEKLAIRAPQGLLKVAQIENICFCARIGNLDEVSQNVLAWLLPPFSIICILNVPFFSALVL